MRCNNLRHENVPAGNGCTAPGEFNEGCIYEVPWESLALADATTDATLKHVPRSGKQVVIDFIVDVMQTVQAATGPGPGESLAAYLTALTRNGISYMPKHHASSGAGVTSNKYALSAFRREVVDKAGGSMAALQSGRGTPWSQFGVHTLVLDATATDDITATIENQSGLAADFGGVFVVLQLPMEQKGRGAALASAS